MRSADVNDLALEIRGPDLEPDLLREAERHAFTPYECLAYTQAFRPEILPSLHHVLIRSEAVPTAILSYYEQGRQLVVVNRLLRLEDDVLRACTQLMLSAHPRARAVQFDGLYSAMDRHGQGTRTFSWATIDCAEVELPRSFEDYMQQFGSATRKNLRYCARRLEREFPTARFEMVAGPAMSHDVVAAVIELNHLRMAAKGKASGMDRAFASHLTALGQAVGVGCVVVEESKVVAGTLCSRIGAGWTLHVIAHDPRFNHLRLGLLCLLRSVQEAIGSGATRFNFLWGASDYKTLFGARIRPLHARRYYRNSFSQLLSAGDFKEALRHGLVRALRRMR
jgi:hypothetical protein